MPRPRQDLKAKKFYHLTMLQPARSGGAGVGVFWLAQCDCGTIKEVRGSDVTVGRIKTCGSCEYHYAIMQTRPPKPISREQGERAHLRRYINSALKRKIPWLLTPEQFSDIIKEDCTYCGASPRAYKSKHPHRRRGVMTTVMNGVDRVDNDEGYTLSNTVPCCSTCNRMKMALSVQVFLDQCAKITRRMNEAAALLAQEKDS